MTFEYINYSIVSSLNERTIYIKVIDTISFMCYESNIDSKELRLSNDLGDSYKLMCKCFQKEDGYNLIISVNTGIMKLAFVAIIEGYFKINFEIMLKEKIMSNDGQLSLNFNRIEQKQSHAIQLLTQKLEKLEEIIEAQSYAEICLMKQPIGNSTNLNSHIIFWKLNTTELTLISPSRFWDYSKIKLFYKLEKITITGCKNIINFTKVQMSNKTVKELIFNSHPGLTSLTGLDLFPNLEIIRFTGCSGVKDIVSTLNSYKHKINHICITSCAAVNNTELMTYCTKINIKLDLA